MEISAHLLSASKISLQLGDDYSSYPKFVKNDILQGKVIKTISSNDALLLINGRKVTARTQQPLKEGSMLLLKVEESSPVPTLKLLGPAVSGPNILNPALILAAMQENLWESILKNISQSPVLKEDEHLLRELMTHLSTKLFRHPDPNLLKDLISKSGLSWEKKLKEICFQQQIGADSINKLMVDDLKGLVSRLLSLNAENEVVLNKFISTLKSIQLLNHLGIEQDRKIFLPIPMQFPNGLFTVGQLLIHLYQEQKDAPETNKNNSAFYRLSFLLELSNLGPLRADLTIKDKVIDGRFLFSKKESKLLFEKHLLSLINNLQNRGFSIRHMECSVKRSEDLQQSLIKEIVQQEGSTVSLMA